MRSDTDDYPIRKGKNNRCLIFFCVRRLLTACKY